MDSPAKVAALARVRHRTSELAIEHDDWPIDICLDVAMLEELILNGDPDAPVLVGILNAQDV